MTYWGSGGMLWVAMKTLELPGGFSFDLTLLPKKLLEAIFGPKNGHPVSHETFPLRVVRDIVPRVGQQ